MSEIDAPKPPKSRRGLLIGCGVALLLIVVVGGFLYIQVQQNVDLVNARIALTLSCFGSDCEEQVDAIIENYRDDVLECYRGSTDWRTCLEDRGVPLPE